LRKKFVWVCEMIRLSTQSEYFLNLIFDCGIELKIIHTVVGN